MFNKFTATIAAVFIAGAASAATTTIDFESFADTQNLNGTDLGGVTITNPSGNVEVYANNRFGVGSNSGSKAIGSFRGSQSVNPMIFTFSQTVDMVSLFGGDGGGDDDAWRLDVYDAAVGGNLLGSVATTPYNGTPYQQLSLSFAGILRAEAIWTGPAAGVGFDDLTFNTAAAVPLPAGGALLLGGLAGLGWMRRKKA